MYGVRDVVFMRDTYRRAFRLLVGSRFDLRIGDEIMEQLLLHLIGDYITQTDWMATEKTKRSIAAQAHALIYSLPFLLICPSIASFLTILWSHYFIDRNRLARYVVFAKNWITNTSLRWSECSSTGYPASVPPFLAVWLMIIADNTMHLTINYCAIRWL